MRTCTWAPTTFQGTKIVARDAGPVLVPKGEQLVDFTTQIVKGYERIGVTDVLIAQRWWGTGEEIEGSSLDRVERRGHIIDVYDFIINLNKHLVCTRYL